MNFRTWVESWQAAGETISVPFEANGKNYLMKFLPLGLNNYFPYSPIAGTIYRIFWMPAEQAANPIEDEKYARTGGNTFSQVKSLLQTIEQLIQKLIIDKQPHGLTWVGNDPTLGAVWGRLSRKLPQFGYHQSKDKPNVYLRKDIYDKAHEIVFESTINDLYKSTVDAFPKTTLRQHATDTIKIAQLSIVPFKGMKTIYFKGLAQNEGREYNSVILFKAVDYNNNAIQIVADDGRTYNLAKLSPATNEVVVRCNCKDFQWRWNYYDFVDHSLYGRKRTKYEGNYRINPKEMPGMCKHLISLTKALVDSGIMIE